jgi:hypothetical protein
MPAPVRIQSVSLLAPKRVSSPSPPITLTSMLRSVTRRRLSSPAPSATAIDFTPTSASPTVESAPLMLRSMMKPPSAEAAFCSMEMTSEFAEPVTASTPAVKVNGSPSSSSRGSSASSSTLRRAVGRRSVVVLTRRESRTACDRRLLAPELNERMVAPNPHRPRAAIWGVLFFWDRLHMPGRRTEARNSVRDMDGTLISHRHRFLRPGGEALLSMRGRPRSTMRLGPESSNSYFGLGPGRSDGSI